MGSTRVVGDASPLAAALIVGHGSRALGVRLTRGEGDRSVHDIYQELASPQLGAIAESMLSPPC
jgi:hypothetical protein